MELKVQTENKIVEIWLTNAEKGDQALRERLKPLCGKYKEQGYLVAVFRSGGEDLAELTSGLLLSNRKRMAEREVQEERRQGMELAM